MLPVGVVIPTRNSMAYLPRHVASVLPWIDLASEVVIVDSESTDGTLEFLKSNLKHPALKIFNRPRGLYEAWNFGIAQLNASYTYISTVGDTLTREGLKHLVTIAQAETSDVVISPPRFIDAAGADVPNFEWPVQRLIKNLCLTEPRSLSRTETIVSALANGMNSFLGSSASNLYRTAVLQKFPFPTNFGHMGDTAWGIEQCGALKVTITPTMCSTFLFHPKEHEPDYSALAPKLFELAGEMKNLFARDPELQRIADVSLACDLLAEIALECNYQHQINRARQNQRNRLFNFNAWLARMKRNRQRRRIRKLRSQFRHQELV